MSASRIAPASVRPGSRRWPGLSRKKVTLALASTAAPRILPVSPSIPEGTSTASTWPPARAKALMRSMIAFASPSMSRARPAPNRASITQSAWARSIRGRGKDRTLIASGGERRIAFQGLAAAEQAQFNRIAARRQEPPGDEAVAPIAAGAAENGDPAAGPGKPRRFVSDRETRPLHERDARRSGRNRKAVGFAHFSWRQKLRVGSGIAHGREGARGLARGARGPKTPFPSRRILLYRAPR